MSRRLAQQYHCQPLAELTRQLLVAPPEKRIDQVRRAEKLHDELADNHLYPYEFLHFRITGYRSESEQATLVGAAVLPDLRLLIDSLSRSVGMPLRADEPCVTPAELAGRLNVSTKTIERWRKAGLRWRWAAASPGQSPQLVLTEEAVERFHAKQKQRVERASRFTQMSDEDRQALIRNARAMASQPGMTLFRTARQLARATGRAVETVRLLLEQHEQANPGQRIFADHAGLLTQARKRQIVRAARAGESIAAIGRRHGRTAATIRRLLLQRKAALLRRVKLSYVNAPMFLRDDADAVLLRPEAPCGATGTLPRGLEAAVVELPDALRPLFLPRETLDASHLRSLLVRMNYLKFKAMRSRQTLDRRNPPAAALRGIESCIRQAGTLRQRLFSANLWHVLLTARQHQRSLNAPGAQLIDLLEIGLHELAQTLDSYDAGENDSFETYLNWRLLRRLARYDPPPARAHRRLTGEEMLMQLRRAAAAHHLRVPPT